MKESITRKRRAPSVANIGSQCDLSLKIPGGTWSRTTSHFSPTLTLPQDHMFQKGAESQRLGAEVCQTGPGNRSS